jgi:PLP dependent protein
MAFDQGQLLARYAAVRQRIADSALACGRDPNGVGLVAVSKFHDAEEIEALARNGQLDFGESYIQEALAKQPLVTAPVRWHFIGHLQTNKARFLPENFHLFHGLDSIRLARALHSKSLSAGIRQKVLIQVDLGGEAQKSGVSEADLLPLAEKVLSLEGLHLLGLMLMPPFEAQGEAARPFFSRLRSLKEELDRRLGTRLPHLSMGMSGDYPQAIAEGATLIRIGTDIFGPRSST